MKNLTLRIDGKVLAEARKLAALRGTTVAKLVREYLAALVAEDKADRTWTREEIYAGRMDRLREGGAQPPGFAEPPAQSIEMTETTAARRPTLEEMTTDTGAPPAPGHDEWFRRQVRRALDDKKAGKADYRDFDEVAAEFGFNAR